MSLDLKNVLSLFPSAMASISSAINNQITNNPVENAASTVFKGLPSVSQALSTVRLFSDAGSVVATEVSSLINRQKRQDLHNPLLTELGLASAPNKEAYLQILIQQAVYNTYPNGHLLTASDHFTSPQYRVKKTIEYPEGMKIMMLVADDPEEAPLMLIRGTDVGNIHNVMDDLHKNIGTLNTKLYKKELAKELEMMAMAHGRIHILGHSYGGAIAQRLTSKYPELICRCSYYNAPGVGDEVVQAYNRNIATLSSECPRPEIVSYRHAKDLASLLGGTSLPTDPGRNYTAGNVYDTISHIEAHSFNSLSTGIPHTNSKHSHRYYGKIASFLENCRGHLGKVIPPS